MLFTEMAIAGAFVIELDQRIDDRGFFARTFCREEFAANGLDSTIAQESISFNKRRGTVRGIHYQAAPHGEAKLVRCTAGSVYDVIVDVRLASPTFGKWAAVELSAENRRSVYIPAGLGHGFQTLGEDSELLYQMSHVHVADAARGIRWDDATLSIDWPIRVGVTVSPKDLKLPELNSVRADRDA